MFNTSNIKKNSKTLYEATAQTDAPQTRNPGGGPRPGLLTLERNLGAGASARNGSVGYWSDMPWSASPSLVQELAPEARPTTLERHTSHAVRRPGAVLPRPIPSSERRDAPEAFQPPWTMALLPCTAPGGRPRRLAVLHAHTICLAAPRACRLCLVAFAAECVRECRS